MKNSLICVDSKVSNLATTEDLSFIYVTNFNDEAVKEFYINIRKLDSDPKVKIIPIIINSYGGQVYSLLAMLDILSNVSKPVCTVALGKAMSCGSLLLAAGTHGYRYVGENADIMIHEVSSAAWGKTTEVKEDIKNTARLNDMILTKLSKLCHKKDKKFFHREIKKRTNLDWYLTGKDCTKLGIADKVGVPAFIKE